MKVLTSIGVVVATATFVLSAPALLAKHPTGCYAQAAEMPATNPYEYQARAVQYGECVVTETDEIQARSAIVSEYADWDVLVRISGDPETCYQKETDILTQAFTMAEQRNDGLLADWAVETMERHENYGFAHDL